MHVAALHVAFGTEFHLLDMRFKMSNFSKQRRQILLGGVGALGAAVIGAKSVYAQTGATTEKFTVVMDWLPSWRHAAFHLAKVKGWYRDAGLDVQVEDGSGSTTTIAQTFAGRCDVGLASLSTMAVARGKGTDVLAAASIIRKNDLGLFVDKKLGITDPKQLAQKKVKVLFASSGFQSLFPPFFKNLGVDINELHLIPMSTGAVEGAYLSGQGDALITTVPYVSPVVDEKRPSITFMFADYGMPLPAHGLVVSRGTIEKRADALRKFIAATQRAHHQVFYGNAREALDALIDQRPQAKINVPLALQRIAAYKPFTQTSATQGKGEFWMPPSDWDAAVKVLIEGKLVPAGSKSTDFYTNAYLPKS